MEDRARTSFEQWRDATAGVEWLCHVGVGRFFAPWDHETVEEYGRHRDALLRAVDQMRASGAMAPGRAIGARAAVAAHGDPYGYAAVLDALRERDEDLRLAFTPPSAVRAAVRAEVPEGPWPFPRFLAPPPRPRGWRVR